MVSLFMNGLPEEIKSFLSSNSVATIATVTDDKDYPYVLPVFYVVDDNFKLYFISPEESRKVKNILANPHMSVSITDTSKLISLQLHGTATVSERNPKLTEWLIEVSNKNSYQLLPPMMQIKTDQTVVVSFNIDWYQLSNYSGKEFIQIEGTFIN